MSIQNSAAIGHADHSAKAAQQNVVMDMLGASYARKYYSVMVIFAWLVSAQADTCQPPTLTT